MVSDDRKNKILQKLKNDVDIKYSIIKYMDDDLLNKMIFHHPSLIRLSHAGYDIFTKTYPHMKFSYNTPLLGWHKIKLSQCMNTPFFLHETKQNTFSITLFDEHLALAFNLFADEIDELIKTIDMWIKYDV